MSTRIGHYDLVTELGRGGMGVVYKGHEPALNRYVAIKMLSPQLAHDDSIKERFLREARSMAALNDPHIIQIYFIGEEHGQPYFAMEFVEGESLSSYLKRDGRLSPQQAARVIYQTAQGLATAHDRGVIHRDIKPGNLMLDQRGRIKIADFGIALSATDFSKKLTSTGEFVGTPGYLSPEVCTGQPVDLRSDIFSLGIVMFELLTGRMPFTDESPLGLLLEVVRAEIPDVRELNADVDEGLVAILRKMTAKEPAGRYASCHELAADLARHPLVAGANTVSATPVLSPAAATSLGMRTPPQLKMPTPASNAAAAYHTQQAQQQPAAAAPAAAAQPARRASVLEAQGQREHRSSGAIWAIAAVLLLGVGGAGAWAFRDRIPFLAAPAASVATLPATQQAAPPVPSPSPAAIEPAPAATVAATDTRAPVDLTGERDASAIEPAPLAESAPTSTVAEEPAPAATGIAGAADADAEADAAAEAEAIGPLRRMAAARKGELARAPPPEPRREPARDLGPGKVAVVTIGDPALTGPARQVIEEELMNSGFLVADTDMVPGLENAAAGGLPGMFHQLARAANVRAVTVIKAEAIGETQLNYYGQSDILYSATLSVRSYDVRTRSPLNAGSRSKVDFTALNADQKAREAIELELRRVVSSLGPYRPKGRNQ